MVRCIVTCTGVQDAPRFVPFEYTGYEIPSAIAIPWERTLFLILILFEYIGVRYVPSITKLHRFYTCSFVCIPRQKRKQLAGKGFIGRAEVGRLMGFRSPFSSTFKVLLSKTRMVHSINVTFDDSNCTNKINVHCLPRSLHR